MRGTYIWNYCSFVLNFPTLTPSLVQCFFLFFSLSFFLTLCTPPEARVSCTLINGFQVTEVTKATRAAKTELWPRAPEGISVRAFFISIYQPSFSSPAFTSDLPTTCRERTNEAHMERKGQLQETSWEKMHMDEHSSSPRYHLLFTFQVNPRSHLTRSQSQVSLWFQNDQPTPDTPQQQKENTSPNEKWAKDLNRHCPSPDREGSQHMKNWSPPLMRRETPIQNTWRYHLTPLQMAMIRKSINNQAWRGCHIEVALIRCGWICTLVQPLWTIGLG